MKKGKIVKASKEFVKYKNLSSIKNVPSTKTQGSGIYAMYNEYGLYYIGLSHTSIRGRLRKHATKDRHKGKWDRFSWYQIPEKNNVKDIETILLSIINPRGNRVKGKFKKKKRKSRKKNV